MQADQVETAPEGTPEARTAPLATPPSPASATTALPDFEAQVAQRVDRERRTMQAAKDRELAAIRRQEQARTRALIEQAQAQVAQYNPEAAAALPQAFAEQAELAELRALREAEQEEKNSQRQAADIAQGYGLDPADPRLWDGPSASWQDFHAKAKRALAEDARAERERLKAEAAREAQAAVDGHVASGNLTTLTGAHAAPPNKAATADDLYAELNRLLASPSTKAQRDSVKEKLRALGETI